MYSKIEPWLANSDYVILDMRRVQSIDVTAAHMLDILQDIATEKGNTVILSHLPSKAPTGQDMRRFFDQAGLVKPEQPVKTFDHLHDALEWVEDRILAEHHVQHADQKPLELREINLFQGRKEETLLELEACMENGPTRWVTWCSIAATRAANFFLIRRGSVRILLPLTRRS